MSEVVMCSKCKTWVSPGAKTCPKCGAPIVSQEMLNQAIVQRDEAEEQKKKNVAVILSSVIFLIVMFMTVSSLMKIGGVLGGALITGIIAGLVVGGIPCGWIGIKGVRDKMKWMLYIIPIGPVFWVCFVVWFACVAGIVLFPVYLVKFIMSFVNKKKA